MCGSERQILDHCRETARVIGEAEARRQVRRASRSGLIPGDDGESIGKAGELRRFAHPPPRHARERAAITRIARRGDSIRRSPRRARSVERSAEGPERLPVVRLDDEPVLVGTAFGLRGEGDACRRRTRPPRDRRSRPGRARAASSPSTQIARSLPSAGSLTPSTRFQATSRPSVAVPTPADQRQTVWRG